MDNDNKIKSDSFSSEQNGVSLFLNDELIPLKRKKKVVGYDLETEYAKTRKNKSLSIWFTLLACILITGLVTYISVSRLSDADRKIEVRLDAFEDLNLKNLFDALSKTQELYETASKNKASIQATLDTKLHQARLTRDSDLELIRSMKLGKNELARRTKLVRDAFNKSVKSIHDELDEQLAVAEAELKQYEEQIKSYDSQNVEKAQEFEKAMDSERQVRELEKKQLVTDYESQLSNLRNDMKNQQQKNYEDRRSAINQLKRQYEAQIAELDPIIKDEKVASIFTGSSSIISEDALQLEKYGENNSDSFNQSLQSMKEKYENYVYLNNYLSAIPQKNTAKEIANTQKKIAFDMINDFALEVSSLMQEEKSKSGLLEQKVSDLQNQNELLQKSADSSAVIYEAFASSEKADGFILSIDDAKNIIVYMTSDARKLVTQDGSSKVNILNAKGRKIGTGALWFKQTTYYLFVDEMNEEIVPGSLLRLQKK